MFCVSAVKEGIDDYRRYKSDLAANLRLVFVCVRASMCSPRMRRVLGICAAVLHKFVWCAHWTYAYPHARPLDICVSPCARAAGHAHSPCGAPIGHTRTRALRARGYAYVQWVARASDCRYRHGAREAVASQDVAVGDIVYVPGHAEVPADIVVLRTSDPAGGAACHVETANLDGETDLKPRRVRASAAVSVVVPRG